MTKKIGKLYHYTTVRYLSNILKMREIILTEKSSIMNLLPAVWFTTNPVWEETANKGVYDPRTGISRFGNKFDTYKYGNGLARIEVKPKAAPYNWNTYKKISKLSVKHQKGLIRSARESGSDYRQWRVSLKPVKEKDWLFIEILDWETQIWRNSSNI